MKAFVTFRLAQNAFQTDGEIQLVPEHIIGLIPHILHKDITTVLLSSGKSAVLAHDVDTVKARMRV